MWAIARSVFHWKYSNWAIPLFGSAALTAALADKFVLAYWFTAIAGIYSAGCWLASETLHKKISTFVLYDGRENRLQRRALPWQWITFPSLAILLVVSVCMFGIYYLQISYELRQLEGWIYPANEDINVACPIRPGELALITGGGNVHIASSFPHTVIAINCDDILVLNRRSDNSVGVSLRVFDQTGKIVVEMANGHFEANRNNIFKLEHPRRSRSTLSVVDQSGNEVLYLHMPTKNVLQIRAIIRDRRLKHPIVIKGDSDRLSNGSVLSGNCMYPAPIAFADVLDGTCLVR